MARSQLVHAAHTDPCLAVGQLAEQAGNAGPALHGRADGLGHQQHSISHGPVAPQLDFAADMQARNGALAAANNIAVWPHVRTRPKFAEGAVSRYMDAVEPTRRGGRADASSKRDSDARADPSFAPDPCVRQHRRKPRAALTADQATAIYGQKPAFGRQGPQSIELAQRYGVDPKTIRDIWNQETWIKATHSSWTRTEFLEWKNSDRKAAKRNRVAKNVTAESSSPTHDTPCEDHAAEADSDDFVLNPALFNQLLPKRGRPAGAKDNKPRKKPLLASASYHKSTDAPATSLQASPEPDPPTALYSDARATNR